MRLTELKNVGDTKAGLLSGELGIDTLEGLAWSDETDLEAIDGLSGDLVGQAQDALPDFPRVSSQNKTVWCSDCDFSNSGPLLKSCLAELKSHRAHEHEGAPTRVVFGR